MLKSKTIMNIKKKEAITKPKNKKKNGTQHLWFSRPAEFVRCQRQPNYATSIVSNWIYICFGFSFRVFVCFFFFSFLNFVFWSRLHSFLWIENAINPVCNQFRVNAHCFRKDIIKCIRMFTSNFSNSYSKLSWFKCC